MMAMSIPVSEVAFNRIKWHANMSPQNTHRVSVGDRKREEWGIMPHHCLARIRLNP